MFGFGRKPDHFDELMEHLVEKWKMRTRCASAFLSAYRSEISRLYEQGAERVVHTLAQTSPEQRLMFDLSETLDFALVGQAYTGYTRDLRHGKYVNTDVELVIWAILSVQSELLETYNRPLAEYINKEQEKLFPNLVEQVFKFD